MFLVLRDDYLSRAVIIIVHHLLCRLFCAFCLVYLYRKVVDVLYDYKTQNLNHTFNGPSKIQLKLFCCRQPQHNKQHNHNHNHNHNNTTTNNNNNNNDNNK